MPPSQAAAKARSEPRSWSIDWIGQFTGRCTNGRPKRPIMLIENAADACSECHEARLQKRGLDDIEAERREVF